MKLMKSTAYRFAAPLQADGWPSRSIGNKRLVGDANRVDADLRFPWVPLEDMPPGPEGEGRIGSGRRGLSDLPAQPIDELVESPRIRTRAGDVQARRAIAGRESKK